jgi:DNA polymerase I-like protein with 3'-5' exonuclease and polymerase domains
MRRQKKELEAKLFNVLKVPLKERTDEFPWAGKHFAETLLKSGIIPRLPLTAKGNPSVSADNLAPLIPPDMGAMFELRAQLQTCISTFAEAWLKQAEHGGRFYAHYNQVRQDYHGGAGGIVGTTTGRLSQTPNLQNVIRSDKGSQVPRLRKYLVPLPGRVWIKADFKSQEYRILGHYEEGALYEAYRANPDMDFHDTVGRILAEKAQLRLERPALKTINFSVLYGAGVFKLSKSLGLDETTTRNILAAYHSALPGAKQLQKDLKELARNNEPLYTWGGRRYYCEPPKWVKDKRGNLREQTYEYRMLNLLIQGSAADATKEAMVRYDATGWNEETKGPLLLQVHDELNSMAHKRLWKQAMKVLKECMESLEFDVPMLTDISMSLKSWDELKKAA